MHLTLLASDLVPPASFIAPAQLPHLPARDSLMARGSLSRKPGMFLEECLLDEFRCTGPVAPLTLLADNGNPGTDAWLRADPVHLRVSGDNVQLLDSHVLQPTDAEAQALVASINLHLAGDGIQIHAADAARWYVRISPDDIPVTIPLWRMAGGSVFENLPRQTGKTNWRALQNELQMLLFDHPVNKAREQQGIPTINGIWFWGGGVASRDRTTSEQQRVVARLALARGLARRAALDLVELPLRFSDLPHSDGKTIVVLHHATRELRANDVDAWRTVIAALGANWFEPASRALSDGKLASLRLVLPNEDFTLTVDCTRATQMKFWRRAKPISSYA
jgi:hypothetical protein